jgi:hypothetical protein
MSLLNNRVDNTENQTSHLFLRKHKIHIFYFLIISVCLFNISINFYSADGIRYDQPSSVIKPNCNDSIVISNFTSICPDRFNKCYLYSRDYTIFNYWTISIGLFIILVLGLELYNYKYKNPDLSSFLYNLHNWSKFNSAILFWSCVYYFIVPVLIYRNNNLCGANKTCDYQFFVNKYCDNINKYCDQTLYNTCRINGTFTFNYENTNVINQFRESQLFLPYLYIPVVIVCGLSMWLTKKE